MKIYLNFHQDPNPSKKNEIKLIRNLKAYFIFSKIKRENKIQFLYLLKDKKKMYYFFIRKNKNKFCISRKLIHLNDFIVYTSES